MMEILLILIGAALLFAFGTIAVGTVITGKTGKLKTGSAVMGTAEEYEVTDIAVTVSGGTIDVTDSGAGRWRKKVPGKYASWSGTASAFIKAGVTPLLINTVYNLHFLAESSLGDEKYWSGEAVVTEVGVSIPVEGEDAVKVTFNFEGTGELVHTDDTQV
jgi:predicted secreted protein